jgi:hypothetical protein
MRPQVTPEQLKSLKAFSLYCRSYGAETASKEYYIESCDFDSEDDYFLSPNTNTPIKTYDRIDEVLDEIIQTNELFDKTTTDCDLRGQLTLHFDCINRTLTATAGQWEYSYDESGDSKTLEEIGEEYDEETYNEILRIFEQIGEDGEAQLQFNGGGDRGALDDFIYINGVVENISKLIENMAYQWLTDTGVDWYNNEGGQGSFIFSPRHSEIVLNIEQNYEEFVNVPMNFEIHF